MRPWSVAILLIVATSSCVAGADNEEQQRLKAAGDVVSIAAAGAKPFELEADFNAQVRTPQGGHITWKWLSRDRWLREIAMGDFREIDVRNGDNLYIRRNNPFTPLRIAELENLLNVFSYDVAWQIKKARFQAINGVTAACMQIHRQAGHQEWNPKREICINQSSSEVLNEELKDDHQLIRKEFSDYQPLGDHSYPRQLKMWVDGSLTLKVNVTALRASTFEDAVFVPPAGAVVRRQCEHITFPVALKTPDPEYPKSASQNRMMGTTTVALTVLPDGSVENIQVVGSAGGAMDRATQDTLKGWKFKPAMCGTEPVTYDIRVEVNFALQ